MQTQTLAKLVKEAERLLTARQFAACLELLQEGLLSYEGSPHLAHLHTLVGLCYHLQSKFPQALGAFQQALRQDPLSMEALTCLCLALCDLGSYEQAAALYAELQVLPASRAVQASFPFDEAKEKLAEQHSTCAKAYRSLRLWPQALVEYQKALSLQPENIELTLNLASLYRDLGRHSEAKGLLEALVKKRPNEPKALIQLGLAHYRQGSKSLAKQLWDQAAGCPNQDQTSQAFAKIGRDLETFSSPSEKSL